MSKILKIISLVCIINLILISGCQGKVDVGEPDNTPEAPVYTDLEGAEIKYAVATGHAVVNNVLGYLEDTAFAELAAARINEVEANYNCKLNIQYMVYDAAAAEFKKALATGDNFADVIQHESYIMQDFARTEGALVGMSELVSQLDYHDTAKWGNKNILESMFWEKDLYGVVPMAWPELLYTSSGYPIVFNGNLVKQIGATDPREFVEKKEWTWDKFEEVLHTYTTTNGETTIYGMAVHPPYFSGMMVSSNNVKFAYKEGDVYKAGLYTPEAEAALSRAQFIYNTTSADCFFKGNITPEGVVDIFINNGAVMASVSSGNIYGVNSKISFEVENTGILPYPAGPNNPEFQWKSIHESMYFIICFPSFSANLEEAATAINALYEPLPGFETPEKTLDYMTRNMFFDPRDSQVFYTMLSNTEYNYFKDNARAIIEQAIGYNTKPKAISEILGANEASYNKIVETVIAPVMRGVEAVWGE